MVLILVLVGTILILKSKAKNNLPQNTIILDQLNIKTKNPQPAGKNITN